MVRPAQTRRCTSAVLRWGLPPAFAGDRSCAPARSLSAARCRPRRRIRRQGWRAPAASRRRCSPSRHGCTRPPSASRAAPAIRQLRWRNCALPSAPCRAPCQPADRRSSRRRGSSPGAHPIGGADQSLPRGHYATKGGADFNDHFLVAPAGPRVPSYVREIFSQRGGRAARRLSLPQLVCECIRIFPELCSKLRFPNGEIKTKPTGDAANSGSHKAICGIARIA